MLKNDKVNLVIALLIAIGLWTYVMVEVNPEKDSLIKDVPISFLNEEALEENSLTLLSVSDMTVDVTIKGRVSDLKGVKKDDIKIHADLEGYKVGEHTVRLQIGRIDNVEIECKQKISIMIDELVMEEKSVWVSMVGDMNDDQEPYVVQASPQKIAVRGAKTLVDSVVCVNAPLDVEKVGNELKAFTVPLYPVDAAGETVDKVSLDVSSASVSAVNLNKKTVRLNVPVLGQEIQNMERVVTVPKTITIKGMDADLDSVSFISAEAVDVTEIYEDTSIPIVPILPDGVELAANSQELHVQVSVKGMGSRSFEYSNDAVIIEGIAEDAMASMEDVNIHLTVTGKETITEYLEAEDFMFYVNVKNLEAGTHQLELYCRHEKELQRVEYGPKLVTVTIISELSEPESGDGNHPDSESGEDTEPEPEHNSGEQNDSDVQTESVPEV